MTQFEQEQAAKKFVEIWKDKGNERSEAQKFWIQLLREVYGVKDSEQYIDFELPVKIKNTSFADGFIADTKVLIEMKGKDVDLTKPEKQSDGSMLTPFQQAKRYADELVYDKGVRWIIVSNFKEIHIYDMKKRHQEPETILLNELPKYYYVLQILVNDKDENIKKEEQISKKAGDIIGKIYDLVKPLYENPEDDETLKNLNKFCVRLVFCLYAEDAGLFGNRLMFHDYLNRYDPEDLREALLSLFEVLNTEENKRNPYLKEELKAFPYVNGGLFDGNIEIPRLNAEFKTLLLEKASEDFDWTEISPTIFGGVFESTLNPETRRNGGMHYTSVENIRKLIKPLFLDDLQYEFESIKSETTIKSKKQKLEDFQDKISSLRFLDPACGSGNFLTQTYLELRDIENEIIKELVRIDKKQYADQIQFSDENSNLIKVSINQFYGIEINDFAVSVAKTALWIAEHQMFEKTRAITYMKDEFLPLRTYTNIIEGNALRIDWNDVVDKNELNYIMGNPPFIGAHLRSIAQSEDVFNIFGKGASETKLDYVLCWYKKSLNYIENTKIKVAFVSTDSICQGESVPTFWKNFINSGIEIKFAYTSFKWSSEANEKAQVYCVIIGFAKYKDDKEKLIYKNDNVKKVKYINAYLMDAPECWLINRSNFNLCDMPKIIKGSEPTDGGNLLLTKHEKEQLINKYPQLNNVIKKFIDAKNFLNNTFKYCLWFNNTNPADYIKISEIKERLETIKSLREKSTADRIRNKANVPYLFCQIRQPNTDYLVIPRVTSGERKYIPLGFMTPEVICGDRNSIIPNADLYMFGILMSNVHNAWVRAICGKLGTGNNYSPFVYNNFPWPIVSDSQKERIMITAKQILDARKMYPNNSLADLYNELTMPIDLRKAHIENDKAVMEAYGFNWKKMSEADCVAELMKMYQKLVEEEK